MNDKIACIVGNIKVVCQLRGLYLCTEDYYKTHLITKS